MKKFKGKLAKRSSQTQLQVNHHSVSDWTKYDERLIECVENGDVDKLKFALGKKGTSATKVDPKGTTALHTACQLGNVECLEVLLEGQPDLSFVNKSGCSPLHVAAQSGNTECVKKILEHKVHVGTQDGRKMTALHHAAAKGQKGCVELLLNNNASLNGKDKDGRTPLLMAIQGAYEDVVKLLLERGAKVNIADISKKTALMYASLLGLSTTVDMLLKRGANPHLTDSNDHTAEDYARLCHYQDIIDLMHSAPSIATWDAGETSDDTEEECRTPDVEIISQFSSLEDSEVDTFVPLHHATTSSDTGESFSSKASTTLVSPRAANQDLLQDIKELEEENEMLNQELNKLRVQHQKTLERLHGIEAQQESYNAPGGCVENVEEVKRIQELEKEIENLRDNLTKEVEFKNDAEEEIEILKVQIASYQDENSGNYNSSENDEDIDLPGVDQHWGGNNNSRFFKSNQSDQLISLHGQVAMLKLENETLKEQLQHSQVNGDLLDAQVNMPTIPLTVYQQLKESNEDEIFKLKEELEELKITNESLQRLLGKKECCPHCIPPQNVSSDPPSDKTESLVAELKELKYKLEVTESAHRKTINMYRLQLLNAYQNEMDPRIREALQMIIRLRSNEQFC